MKLQGAATPRPMTHDLFTDILSQLEARVVKIAVTELRENTFYALITVAVDGTEIEIDSRPSDAIALAVRSDAPIYAAEAVIEESAIEFEQEDVDQEEVVEEFKKFLDEVKPEDFSRVVLAQLALGEREQLGEERAQALVGEGPGVLACEGGEQALLAAGVEEVPALRQLVRTQLAHQLDALVHSGEDRPIGVRDPAAKVADDWILLRVVRPHGSQDRASRRPRDRQKQARRCRCRAACPMYAGQTLAERSRTQARPIPKRASGGSAPRIPWTRPNITPVTRIETRPP